MEDQDFLEDEHLVADHVMVKFDQMELAMLCNVLRMFFDQSDEVFEKAGIGTEERELKLSDLFARLDTLFWENFDEETILREMWGISMDK